MKKGEPGEAKEKNLEDLTGEELEEEIVELSQQHAASIRAPHHDLSLERYEEDYQIEVDLYKRLKEFERRTGVDFYTNEINQRRKIHEEQGKKRKSK